MEATLCPGSRSLIGGKLAGGNVCPGSRLMHWQKGGHGSCTCKGQSLHPTGPAWQEPSSLQPCESAHPPGGRDLSTGCPESGPSLTDADRFCNLFLKDSIK